MKKILFFISILIVILNVLLVFNIRAYAIPRDKPTRFDERTGSLICYPCVYQPGVLYGCYSGSGTCFYSGGCVGGMC